MTLAEIAGEFQLLDASERIEYLIDFGRVLPPLPAPYRALRDSGLFMVNECQSPVFFHAEILDGTIRIHADVPTEAPVARGFVGLLVHCLEGKSTEQLRDLPDDILAYLGLDNLLGMQRRRGLAGIFRHILLLRNMPGECS